MAGMEEIQYRDQVVQSCAESGDTKIQDVVLDDQRKVASHHEGGLLKYLLEDASIVPVGQQDKQLGKESEPEMGRRQCRLEPVGPKWNLRRQTRPHMGKGHLV